MVLDRRQILDEAERARSKGRTGKALKRYRQLLHMDPGDASIHARIAPLLARRNELGDAQRSFIYAAQDLVAKGFLDRAVGLYGEAVRWLPRDATLWEAMAELHHQRNRRADAVDALITGAGQLHRRRDRAYAIRLLRRALEIDAGHIAATFALAVQLRRSGGRAEARALLDGLVPRVSGRVLRRVRGALVRLAPTPQAIWRWLRAAIRGV
jgi:tetratricopeptide (TPR) repeat protein